MDVGTWIEDEPVTESTAAITAMAASDRSPENGTGAANAILYPSPCWASKRPRLWDSQSRAGLDPSRRLLTIADSENAVAPITDTLRYAGVIKKSGKLRQSIVRGLQIVHTGDMLLKHRPDPAVVKYWLDLGDRINLEGGELSLLAGNHELEIWDCLQRGQHFGLKKRQHEQLRALIRACRLFHVSGSALLIHGYPTLNLLRRLKGFQEETGLSFEHYNQLCFQPALDDPNELTHYRYLKGKGASSLLLHDLEDAASYYRKHGQEIALLLHHLGIEQVIHGHRPERNGVQADFEFRHWLPGIRMIGNDTQLRQRGLGAVIMRMESDSQTEVLLVNTKTSNCDLRRSVRKALRENPPARTRSATIERPYATSTPHDHRHQPGISPL